MWRWRKRHERKTVRIKHRAVLPDLITVRRAGSARYSLCLPAEGGDSTALSIVREYIGEQTEVRCRHFPMSADSAEKRQSGMRLLPRWFRSGGR